MLRRPFGGVAGCVMVSAVAAMVAPAHGALLGLDLEEQPDVFSGFIDVTYDAGTDAFNADGFALKYDDDGSFPSEDITNGLFQIDAVIDALGGAGGGSLLIEGGVLGFGPTLLSGNLLDFGFEDGGGAVLEFLFEVTGGDLAGDYGGAGAQFGVILDVRGLGYSGDWTMDFDNLIGGLPGTGTGVSDTAPLVPAPGVLALFGLAGFSRRRRAS